ncbi:MAG: hypothetical protein ACREP9_18910, partial [Candidatus Dormibacteraceae bacterium]
LYVDAQGIGQTNTSLSAQIADFQANIAQQEQIWLQEYSQVNTTLQSMPLQIQQLDAQMGISNPNSNSSSAA